MEKADGDTFLSRLWDRLVFFGHFFKNPVALSTPMECSSRIAGAIGEELHKHGARRVLELGGGTGSITQGILDALPEDGELMSIEQEEFLCERMRDRFGDRVQVVQGDAREVESLVEGTPFSEPDAIVCSVPLNTSWAGELVETISRVLPQKALYLQVSFTSSPVEAHFRILRSHRILLNLPPERVHVAVHPDRDE
ncbi:MAG: methyltransferase domain-containing protein [Planctomycetota bacterium]